ncbi:MAG: SpoIIE family protein phosphatase [Desulfomonilia bacterium]|jgi:serine phosphatase RsbU (regulator of sigma subunit)
MRDHESFMRFIDALPPGILAVSGDGRVLVWNSAAESITSVLRGDVVGKQARELPDEIRALLESTKRELTIDTGHSEARVIWKTIREVAGWDEETILVVAFIDMTDLLLRKQEMERLLMETAEARDLMEEQAAKLAMALAEVNEMNEIVHRQNRRIMDQLEMAGKLQKSLLPNIYENIGGVSVSCRYIPSIHIGGDLYDVVDLGQSLAGFVIADVSGHGVAAALVSAMFKMSFHTLSTNVASPKILFHMLNQEFIPILSEDYITAFYLLSDYWNRTITFSNAGHPTPLLYRKNTGEVLELDTDGFFLGMFEDGAYGEKTITGIENGDAVLLYTDCLLEARNSAGIPFGMDRLKALFEKTIRQFRGEEAIDRIEAELRVFNSGESFDDDFTVMLLEFWEKADQGDETDPGPFTDGGFVEF